VRCFLDLKWALLSLAPGSVLPSSFVNWYASSSLQCAVTLNANKGHIRAKISSPTDPRSGLDVRHPHFSPSSCMYLYYRHILYAFANIRSDTGEVILVRYANDLVRAFLFSVFRATLGPTRTSTTRAIHGMSHREIFTGTSRPSTNLRRR
jgi:hypothetical protein